MIRGTLLPDVVAAPTALPANGMLIIYPMMIGLYELQKPLTGKSHVA
jgi:hypothetical protein